MRCEQRVEGPVITIVTPLGPTICTRMRPLKMAKKPKIGKKKEDAQDGLWIALRFSLKGASGERAWDTHPIGPPNSSRYLELADIALGLKTPSSKKAKRTVVHDTTKKEPYSS
jgi:hypothetical protein